MRRHLSLLASLMSCAMAADIPIRQIVLYKSGVGYFERAGELHAGETGQLNFKADEMNDVLKSLTIADRSGGKIAGLRYDSSQPLDAKLAQFPFTLNGTASLSAFLDQMKGARVEMKYGAETVSGIIVSARSVAATDKSPEREQAVLMLDGGDLRTVDLAAASSIRFADSALQAQLRDYLTALNQARSKEKRTIYIDSSDTKTRAIIASYMVPMPLWKSSYRLILSDPGQPTLEGWAIVDNTTGEDWTNVKLAVVSGRPVSFISRLYDAHFLQRPTVDLPEDRAQGPVLHEGSFDSMAATGTLAASPAPPPGVAFKSKSGVAGGMLGGVAGLLAPSNMNMEVQQVQSDIVAAAEGRDLGDLFEYSFASPVTVKKNESAMLPFLQQKVNARKLLIYSESYGQNPMSASEISNSTGKTLDGGPITVFDSGNYVGEALISTLRAGDKRLISYAVDLGTRITTKFGSDHAAIREIHLSRGMLTARSAVQETKTYTIHNVDARAKTLIIEHPERGGYKLLNQKPTETTSNAYRFEVKLPPTANEAFAVTEERVYDSTLAVANLTPDVLVSYSQNKVLTEQARNQLKQIADQKRQIADTQRQITGTQNQINDLTRDEERMRQNILSLNSVSGQQEQVQKYSLQLADQERRLQLLRDALGELHKRENALISALDSMVEKLEF